MAIDNGGFVGGFGRANAGQNGDGSTGQNNVWEKSILEDGTELSGFTDIGGGDGGYYGFRWGVHNKNFYAWGRMNYGNGGKIVTSQTKMFKPTLGGASAFQGKVNKVQCSGSYNQISVFVLDEDGNLYGSGAGASATFALGSDVGNQTDFVKIQLKAPVVDFQMHGTTTSYTITALHADNTISSWRYDGHGECAGGIFGSFKNRPVLGRF